MTDPHDDVTLPLPVATDTPIPMRFVSENRLYSMTLTRDLFGDWVLVHSWSGRFNRRGGGRIRAVASLADGLKRMKRVAKIREKHGYAPVIVDHAHVL